MGKFYISRVAKHCRPEPLLPNLGKQFVLSIHETFTPITAIIGNERLFRLWTLFCYIHYRTCHLFPETVVTC